MAIEQIKPMIAGLSPSLRSATAANKLIDAINDILTLKIVPEWLGFVEFDHDSSTVDLTALANYLATLKSGSSTQFPWSPIVRTTDSGLIFGITPGMLWPSYAVNSPISVSGCLSTAFPLDSDSGFTGVPTPGQIGWLELTISSEIMPDSDGTCALHIGSSGEWPGYPDPVEMDTSDPTDIVQVALRIPIGQCVVGPRDDAAASWVTGDGATHCWLQSLRDPVELVTRDADGNIAVVPAANLQLFPTA